MSAIGHAARALSGWLLPAVLDPYPRFVIDCRASFSRELTMKKIILAGVAILAVSTSPVLAKKHAAKPKAPPAAAASAPTAGPMMGQPSAADREMYMKNKRDSGMK
jgi:hypothetical protein